MKQLTPAFQSILREFHRGIEPEIMTERLKFCTSDECLELLRMEWNVGYEDYWNQVTDSSVAMHKADVQKFKNCVTKEERELLVSGWNENHVWSISVEVDADRLEDCTNREERSALIKEWDANYCEAVFLKINDRYSDDY
ncbi:hypothetical protein [Nostoc sp. WHI]|uniref:hypothetical protein n=1 Tax=Nostoc sp. WHI TaxID=2650611 RepID=UPI0018C64C0E|nr:hypothetical protein [Nostoc sp. WHI]MBG1268112.1 hypothetical protein [Nostoc sp. WHI]